MDKLDFIKNIANQVGVIGYAANVPQQGPSNMVESKIKNLAKDGSIDITNPEHVERIRREFGALMSDIISGKGD